MIEPMRSNLAAEADPAYAFFLETAVRISKVVLRLHRSGKQGSLPVIVRHRGTTYDSLFP